jgi:hypothetical protein
MDDNMVEIGEAVLVFEPDDGTKLIGRGKYLGRERIDVEEDDSEEVIFSFDSPKIELNNGKIIYGFECWWIPEKEAHFYAFCGLVSTLRR